MASILLYDKSILPKDFRYPEEYLSIAKTGFEEDIEPWSLLTSNMFRTLNYYESMRDEYKDQVLIPFAIAVDESGYYNDGYVVLACFDGNDISGNPRVYFHDYGSLVKEIEWSKRYYLEGFTTWLQYARDESSRYKKEKYEDD